MTSDEKHLWGCDLIIEVTFVCLASWKCIHCSIIMACCWLGLIWGLGMYYSSEAYWMQISEWCLDDCINYAHSGNVLMQNSATREDMHFCIWSCALNIHCRQITWYWPFWSTFHLLWWSSCLANQDMTVNNMLQGLEAHALCNRTASHMLVVQSWLDSQSCLVWILWTLLPCIFFFSL